MLNPKSSLFVLVALLALALVSGCAVVVGNRVPPSACSQGPLGTIMVYATPASVTGHDEPVSVYIDGKFYGHTEGESEFKVPTGDRVLLLECPGCESYSATVHVTTANTVAIEHKFSRFPSL